MSLTLPVKIGIGAFISIITVLLIILLILKRKQDKEDRINKRMKPKSRTRNYLHIAFLFFIHAPIIRKYFDKVLRTVGSIYPADQMSINKKATRMMLGNIIFAGLIAIVISVFSNGDIFFVAMGILTALVFFDHRVTASLEKMETILLRQLQSFLSDIRHYYMSSKIIEDAVSDTLDDIPFEISLHIQKLYSILTSPIMEEKVEEYAQSNPNRFFMLLTSICSVTKEYGDAEVNGGSNFLNSLAYLKEEVNTELLKRERNAYEFQALSLMALCPVFFIKAIEAWCKSNMPELETFYAGIYGKAIMIVLFIVAYLCYRVVEILRESKRGELIKTSIWSRIAQIPIVSKLTNKIVNKYYTRAMRLNDQMKEVGDQTGPKAFIVQSFLCGLLGFVLVILMFTTSVVAEKMTMLNRFDGGFDETIVPNSIYLNSMQQTSNEYAKEYKNTKLKDINVEVMAADIRRNSKVTDINNSLLVAQAVYDEVQKYQNTFFQWWYIIISLAAFGLGCMTPWLIMRVKIMVASMNKDDEINQFQTLVLILMHTDGVTIDTILEWMNRFAYSFKASIETCILELESGERAAIEKMKMSETYPPFKRFCDCLLEVDQVGVISAFDEVSSDRAYSLKEREQQNLINTENRASKARLIAYVPLGAEFALYLVGPMLILAVKMFMAMDFSF